MLVVAQVAFGLGESRAAEGPKLPPAEYKPLPVGTRIFYDNATFTVSKSEGFATVMKVQTGDDVTWLKSHALFGEYADNMFATRQRDPVFYDIKSADMKSLERLWPLEVGKKIRFVIQEESRAAYGHTDRWRVTLTVAKTETLNLGGRVLATYVVEERGEADNGSAFTGRKWYHPQSGLMVKSTRTWTKVAESGFRRFVFSEGSQQDLSLVDVAFPQGAKDQVLAEKPARPHAVAVASALPPAAYKPLPVGTRIVYDKAVLTVAKQDGFAIVFKQQVGNTVSWPQFHAVFGEHGSDIHVSTARGGAVEFDLDADNKKRLEALWPLAVGKQVVYRLHEGRGGSYGGATQVWTITLKVSATETVEAGGRRVPTYVVDERAESDLGMSFTGRKWYDPARGLIVRSQRIGTGVNAVGDLAWDPKTARLGKDQEEIHTLRSVDYPPGTAPVAVAAVAPKPTGTAAPRPAPSTGPALPPAAYKPLPVGTKVKLDNGALTVARTDGFTTVLKRDGRDVSPWVSLHALFGEYGTNVYASDARGDPVEYDITSANKRKLESLWPLSVGKQTTYRVREVGPSYYGEPQDWTIALKVAGTESVEIEGRSYQTYVVEERGESSGGMGFTGRKWYHPATGLIVQSQRTGTGMGRVARTHAHLGSGQQSAFTMRSVDFPPGTDSVLVAAAQGTVGGGEPAGSLPRPAAPAASPQVAKVEPARRPAEAARPAPPLAQVGEAEAASRRQQADEARKSREAEIAELKREADQVLKTREAEMAKRLAQAEEARKAREAEIAKLKQEAEQALKAREAEIARLRQTLAERRDDKAGDAGAGFSGVEFGRYHALVIGIDNYKHLPKLKTAVNDARAIGELLEKEYGFVVTLLLEPTRNDIVDALDVYREKLGRTDNLLIYYAGHGWLDKEVDRGYWLPIDAEPKRRRDWVSNATITDTLKALSAKHVMVVADSCYSGTLVRSADMGARTRTGDYWKQMATKGARVAITSGGLEPVADTGGGGHSPFAKAFIDALSTNASVMDGTTLFSQMRRPVMVSAKQTPQYADVREAGHDGGDFLFVRKKK